jgi:Protein of unknown function DUF45
MKALMEAIVETLQDSIGSINFWNEVDKVMPDYSAQKEWLRKHGASLVV